MIINEYVKRWCDEEYDVRHEDFFVENAYYVSEKEWAIHGFKHGLLGTVVALAVLFFANTSIASALALAVSILGIFTACFYIFAMKEYDAHSVAGYIFSGALAVFLIISLFVMPEYVNVIFGVAMLPLYVWSTFIRPLRFLKTKKRMKEKIEQMEAEEEEAAKAQYSQWKRGYDAYRYGLPEAETVYSDPMMEEAQKLFDGFTSDKQVLKSRYRQLAKQHHPDRGGDEKLMQCIIAVYEELNKAFA